VSLPLSFARDGFQQAKRNRGLLIGTEGGANSGKTRFALTAPGPGIGLMLDRGYRGLLESEHGLGDIEASWVFVPIDAPLNTGVTKEVALAGWRDFYQNKYLKALANVDARSVLIDGDSDSFEWQMLAEFGRTTQIPQIQRTGLNAARRVMISRAWDSKKIVITTNKLKKKFETVFDPVTGNAIPDPAKPGENKREWDGKSYERQGFNDHEYLYEIQLRHLYKRPEENGGVPDWGIQILMCKANRMLEGAELWGDECNLPTLLQNVYPHIDLKEWGY